MGRKREDLITVVFRLPPADADALARLVIESGYQLERKTKEGQVILPGWRKWGEAIAQGKILMYKITSKPIDNPDKSR